MKKINYLLIIFLILFVQGFVYMKTTSAVTNNEELAKINYHNNMFGINTLSDNLFCKLAGVVIENKFVATGIVKDIVCEQKGIHKIIMKIDKVEQFGDYVNFGNDYVGKSVEIFSEIGIPPSIKIGVKISLVLRVSGDEWGQYLFLVEVFDNEEGI
ncbi:MAG: hypothetical protein ACE5KZ_08905 [Candidatus Scalinduaceae bacterium]